MMTVRHVPSRAAVQLRAAAVLAMRGWDGVDIAAAGRARLDDDTVSVESTPRSMRYLSRGGRSARFEHHCKQGGAICEACLVLDADRFACDEGLFRQLHRRDGSLRAVVGRPRELRLLLERLTRDAGLAGDRKSTRLNSSH